MRISVAGTGYVGLSLAVLLAEKHEVTAVDIVPEKVDLINRRISPIKDEYIEKYLKEKELNLYATLDTKKAYSDAEYVIVATPTNYDSKQNYFDTSAVESVIDTIIKHNTEAVIVIKSTVPVGFTEKIRTKTGYNRIIFSPEFLRESKALYDNLYPSRIIVSTDKSDPSLTESAEKFAYALRECAIKEDIGILIMGFTEAEAVKLFANTYLALRVSFFNECRILMPELDLEVVEKPSFDALLLNVKLRVCAFTPPTTIIRNSSRIILFLKNDFIYASQYPF